MAFVATSAKTSKNPKVLQKIYKALKFPKDSKLLNNIEHIQSNYDELKVTACVTGPFFLLILATLNNSL